MTTLKSYAQLKNLFAELHLIKSIQSTLSWDMEVMLPKDALVQRSQQMSFLTTLATNKLRDPRILDLMLYASEENLENWDVGNLRAMRRIHAHSNAVPVKLLAEYTEVSTHCSGIWRDARANNDWKMLEPYLERLVGIVRQIAQAKSACLNLFPYDALLDENDPGRKSAEIDQYFEFLATEIPPLLAQILEKQGPASKWPVEIPIEKQEKLGLEYIHDLGFDLNSGRLDISTHPFCNGDYPDIRITTRYDLNDPITALYGVLHETGHALYQQQLPRQWGGQPVGDACGMAVHESQSLFVEKQIGRHPKFIQGLYPRLKGTFDLAEDVLSAEQLRNYMLHVSPSFIRVDADEVTYPLHIILRYRIERQLIGGKIEVSDIPELWNQYMQELLGITPPDYNLGCLQDVHWPWGAFGYFPTYTLGAMNAAQLAHKLAEEMPNWGVLLQRGELRPLVEWLGRKVHNYGCLFATSNELLENATGEPLNPKYFVQHLNDRYLRG